MDADALLREHDSRLRKWAGKVSRKYPITFDEALGELQWGFVQGASTWRADGGKSLVNHCRTRAFGQVKDYCRSLSFTPHRAKSAAKFESTGERDVEIATPALPSMLAGMESVEFWGKVHGILAGHHQHQWLVLCLIHREGWTGVQVAKYFGVSEASASHWYHAALATLAKSWSLAKYVRGECRKGPKRTGRLRHAFDIPRRSECCMAGCHAKVHGRGKCTLHYYRDLRQKRRDPDADPRFALVGTFTCECGRPAGASKVCRLCQQRVDAQRRRDRNRTAATNNAA